MSDVHLHETHPAIVKRLNRAHGHLRGVVEMIEGGRPCVEIAQQLHAVERALANARRALIQDHVDHCLAGAAVAGPTQAAEKLDAFRAITKYL
jgi:DNA-binding FrmR family transcriptional regulator